MLKTGILLRERAATHPKRTLALTMLDQFTGTLSESDEATLDRLYSAVRVCDAGNKRTFPHRYRDLDNLIAREIDRRFPNGSAVTVHDMAASNAITSIELFERLQDGRPMSLRASDYFDGLNVVTMPGSRWRVVFGQDNQPLQFLFGRMVVSSRQESRKYPLNRLIAAFASRRVLPRAEGLLASGRSTKIELWHPRARQLADTDSRFSLARDDLFNPAAGAYSALRIMNACHLFAPNSLPVMFAAVGATINTGGILIVGHRKAESPVNASFFERTKVGFRHLYDMNEGFSHRSAVEEAVITK